MTQFLLAVFVLSLIPVIAAMMLRLFAVGRKQPALGFIVVAPVMFVAFAGLVTGGISGIMLAVRLDTTGARIAIGVIGGAMLAYVLGTVVMGVRLRRRLLPPNTGGTGTPALEERLLELWRRPPDVHSDPVRVFAALYADPVVINGVATPVVALVDRARALHAAFSDHVVQLVDRVAQSGKLAIAFRHTARHAGPWRTALGEAPATGLTVTGLRIDIMTISGNRVSQVWVLENELQRLVQVAEPSGPLRPLLGGPVR